MTNELIAHYQKELSVALPKIRQRLGITQAEMAKRIGVSQPKLCDIEGGYSTLTFPEVLVLMSAYNLALKDLVELPQWNAPMRIRQALARFGAFELHQDERVIISEELMELQDVIRQTLVIYPEKRTLCALAPLIVKHIKQLNFDGIAMKLYDIGVDGRLWWLVEGTLWAVRVRRKFYLPKQVLQLYNTANLILTRKSKSANYFFSLRRAYPTDYLDCELAGKRAMENIRVARDALATRWRIMSLIKQEDFTEALARAEEGARYEGYPLKR